jgi:hypothetical protein
MPHRGRVIDDNVYGLNAVLHPGSVYDHPREVLADEEPTLAEKRSILASRASDAAAVTSCPSQRQSQASASQSRLTPSWKLCPNSIVHSDHPGESPLGANRHPESQKQHEVSMIGSLPKAFELRLKETLVGSEAGHGKPVMIPVED